MAHKTSQVFHRFIVNSLKLKSGLLSQRNVVKFSRFLSSGKKLRKFLTCEFKLIKLSLFQPKLHRKLHRRALSFFQNSSRKQPFQIKLSCKQNKRRRNVKKKVGSQLKVKLVYFHD